MTPHLERRPDHGDPLQAAAQAMGMTDVEPQRAVEIGHANRSGFPPRPPATPRPLPPVWEPGPMAKPLPLLEVADCRFPVGEAFGLEQLFCGEVRDAGQPYCAVCLGRVALRGATPNPKVLH